MITEVRVCLLDDVFFHSSSYWFAYLGSMHQRDNTTTTTRDHLIIITCYIWNSNLTGHDATYSIANVTVHLKCYTFWTDHLTLYTSVTQSCQELIVLSTSHTIDHYKVHFIIISCYFYDLVQYLGLYTHKKSLFLKF